MSKNILVVDNNLVILKLMDSFLSREGHNVKTAIGGLEAIEVIKKFQPEIIFVDLIMPKIPGEKLCKMLRNIPEMADVVIIILSAAAVEQKIDFKSFGADACIAKGPFKEVEKHINFVFQQLDKGALSELGDHVLGTENVYERIVTSELLSIRTHFEVTLQNMVEGFVELTGSGRIVSVNQRAADLFGHPEEDMLTADFTDLFSGSQQELIFETLNNLNDKNRIIGEQPPFIYNEKYLAIKMAEITGQDTIIVIIQDITARKQAEYELQNYQNNLESVIWKRTSELVSKNRELEDEIGERQQLSHEKNALEVELRQAHKMEAVGTMATGIAHDFNNLLTAILGYTELLHLETGDNNRIDSHLNNITKAGNRAKELIGLIKTFSKPTEQEFMKVQLPMLIGETLTLLKPSVPSNVKIITDIAPCPDIWADAVQIQQVILNLCTNAMHAMRESGGTLTVNLCQEDDFVKLSFHDTGTGISPANLEKIFDPYFTTKTAGEGTGLGLSVVHGIITHHKGRISAESTEGQGTTFTLFLPVHNSE